MKSSTIDRRALPGGARLTIWLGSDGWAHRQMDWFQPEGAVPRGSLFFANGRGDFIEKYVEAYAYWHARGWNVTTFDWRGQGGSRGEIIGGHLDNFAPLVNDMAGLLAAWLEATPEPHAAVGHSMGGHLLLRMLAEHDQQIDAAVLIAPMLAINSAPLPPWGAGSIASSLAHIGWSRQAAWQQPIASQGPGSARQVNLTGCRERYEDELHWWELEPGYNLGAPSWGWLAAAYRSIARLGPEALAKVAVPTLLIGTERDRLVAADAIERASSLMPRAELLMFDDAAHEILRERDPVRTRAFAAIDTFLDKSAPSPG